MRFARFAATRPDIVAMECSPATASDSIIIRDDRATFEGVNKLCGMEAEDFRVSEIPHRNSVLLTPKSVTGIIKQSQSSTSTQFFQLPCTTNMAPQMHWENRRRSRRDALFGGFQIQSMRLRIHIRKDRVKTDPFQRMRRGDEGKRGDNHFAAEM
jgi:hypothetical protein